MQTARINLGYTTVTSPVSGRIGRSAVTEGAYVQQAQATLLATVQQLDPVYVDVTQSSAEVLRLRRDLARASCSGAGSEQAKVKLVLEDGREYGRRRRAPVRRRHRRPEHRLDRAARPLPEPARRAAARHVRARPARGGREPGGAARPAAGVTRDQKGRRPRWW